MGNPEEIYSFRRLMSMLLQLRGLSAAELSKQAGLSPSYFSKVESGAIRPSLVAFAKIVDVLQITPLEIEFLLKKIKEEDDEKEIQSEPTEDLG